MADFSAYVEIEPAEFVENCSNQEIEELVDNLSIIKNILI